MLNFMLLLLFPSGGAAAGADTAAAADGNVLTSVLRFLSSLQRGSSLVDPEEWARMSLAQKVANYDWTTEMFVVATVLAYVVAYVWGRRANRAKVLAFVDGVQPVLGAEFAAVGCSRAQPIIKDSNSRYTTYASGRDNIESLLARFRLIERTNLLTYALSFVVPAMGSSDGQPDHVHIELKPTFPQKLEPGVFSVINKESLGTAQEDLYFLRAAKPVDTTNAGNGNGGGTLPASFLFMVEHSDEIAALYTPELRAALEMDGAPAVLRWLAFSDIPTTEPARESEVATKQRVYLELNLPRNAAERAAAAQLLEAALHLVDTLTAKPAYRATTQKKIAAAREVEYARIRRAEEEAQREKTEAARAEERRNAARRERGLSEKEQRRLQKKDQDKQARKQRQRMTKFK